MHSNYYEFEFRTYRQWRRPSLLQSIRRWLNRLREDRRMRREIRSVYAPSDRQLGAIGLSRDDLLRARELVASSS